MQRSIVFILKNVLANCKIYESPANWIITHNNDYTYKFILQIFNLIAGVHLAKRYCYQLLREFNNYESNSIPL